MNITAAATTTPPAGSHVISSLDGKSYEPSSPSSGILPNAQQRRSLRSSSYSSSVLCSRQSSGGGIVIDGLLLLLAFSPRRRGVGEAELHGYGVSQRGQQFREEEPSDEQNDNNEGLRWRLADLSPPFGQRPQPPSSLSLCDDFGQQHGMDDRWTSPVPPVTDGRARSGNDDGTVMFLRLGYPTKSSTLDLHSKDRPPSSLEQDFHHDSRTAMEVVCLSQTGFELDSKL
nr:hypothetical protein Iba_chr02bCG12900 [Ipomoea batatas]